MLSCTPCLAFTTDLWYQMAPGRLRMKRNYKKKKQKMKEERDKFIKSAHEPHWQIRHIQRNKGPNNNAHIDTHPPTKGKNVTGCTVPEQLQKTRPSSRTRLSRVHVRITRLRTITERASRTITEIHKEHDGGCGNSSQSWPFVFYYLQQIWCFIRTMIRDVHFSVFHLFPQVICHFHTRQGMMVTKAWRLRIIW